MFAPLKITFRLNTPVVATGYPIHLDAIVAYAVTRREIGSVDFGDVNDMTIRELSARLPLASCNHESGMVWKASALVCNQPGGQSVRMWTRKTNPYDYAERVMSGQTEISTRTRNLLEKGEKYVGAIDTQRGLLKNQFEFYSVKEMPTLEAWCVGDIDELESLLAPEAGLITHIGKRGRAGHGRVVSVVIEPCDEAELLWKNRVLPWRESDDYEPLVAAIRPPYWAIENRVLGYCPKNLI